jgi:alpha-glucosidase
MKSSLPFSRLSRILLVGVALISGGAEFGYAQPAPTPAAAAPSATPTTQPQRSRRSNRVVPMQDVVVASPDGRIKFTLLGNAERLTFKVTAGDAPVIEPSTLALSVDGFDLSAGVVFSKLENSAIDETYPWRGARATAVSRCNVARISLTHDLSFTEYVLEVRVFDDGIAYRHIVAGDAKVSRVPDERSLFIVPSGAKVWFGGMDGHYETDYQSKRIDDVVAGEWAGPPLTAKLPNDAGYLAIAEANLVNYAGMALEADGRRGWIVGLGHRHPLNWPFELHNSRAEAKRLAQPGAVNGPITTPWRVVMIGRDLNTLVNSTILANLCPPPDPVLFPDGANTSWIKPGRAAWAYVDGRPTDVKGFKEFSRLAGQLGFEHHIVEGIWARWTHAERKEFVDYSRQNGVELWFWRHSNRLQTPEARDAFFKMLQDLGVTGAKVDFIDHEAKETVDLYPALLHAAARHHVSIIFHGANKPTGLERTWPNEVVREAIRGMESRNIQSRARFQAIVPFTRLLAGPADYTTMFLGTEERRRDTTWANQIASMAIFSGPLLTIAAHPQHILENPAVDIIKSIPAIWDETIVLPGSEIGELVAFARRKGDTWFVAMMCGPEAKTVKLPLSFLAEGRYTVDTVRDVSGNATAVNVESGSVTRSDQPTLELSAGGGYVARFKKQP